MTSVMAQNPTTADTQIAAARGVIARTLGTDNVPVNFSITPDTSLSYNYVSDGNHLTLNGTNAVALCHGFYDYAKRQGYGLVSWSGTNLQLPADGTLKKDSRRVESPFAHHYLYNVVTYGYTMPFWDWTQWEKEIDWMALHGFDMPLALNAYESIIARVWRKMGLTEDEINSYFSGPAHLPWNRMGNLSGHEGPLTQSWHDRQINLQHRILARMDSLGMTPICLGFAGFVPEGLRRIHPDAKLMEMSWSDGHFHSLMLSPEDPLFGEIGTAFVREWEAEFGPCKYYLVDSFNEMDIPFPPKGDPERYRLLAYYGEQVYNSIRQGNPEASWAMQGWMFGYQQHIWDYETLGALVSKVPNDKMLLLDLAVDYNKHFWHTTVNWEFYRGFYDKQWVYSVIPNMGGKTGMTGVLDFYANGHREALRSANRGNLIAHGMAPEGTENNEVIYELLSDAGWTADSIDVQQWLKGYALNRYGSFPKAIETYYDYILKDTYNHFTDHPRYAWQFRPGTAKNGSILLTENFWKAVQSFGLAAEWLGGNALYRADLAELAALYLGGKAEVQLHIIDSLQTEGRKTELLAAQKRFIDMLCLADDLLSTHPTLRMERWIDFARRAAGGDEALADNYERDARRLVTIWGPPVEDYSARVWSGLIRDYVVPRWQHYFDQINTGQRFDFETWEEQWVRTRGLSAPTADTSPEAVLDMARRALEY